MFKTYKVCDPFLEVACHCLHASSDSELFQKNVWGEIWKGQ